VSDVVARVLSGRSLAPDADLKAFLEARLSSLDSPDTLADIERAAKRIARAIMGGETIAQCVDYDSDGTSSGATIWRAIVEIFGHPREKLLSFVGHRLEEGYGLTEPVANRILAARPRPTLLITADQGSSDEVQIARLRAAGIVTVVSDHHSLPIAGPPASAYAVINPQRADCAYPDDAIAGGMVAWLLMCVVRRELIAAGWLPTSSTNPLVELLDGVAIATTADCVHMASLNNRAVVRAGLSLMNTRTRACWAGMKPLLKTEVFRAETIAFGIAPRIHARSRLADSMLGLEFLLADDVREAARLAHVLDEHNQARKLIEREMLEMAIAEAESRVASGRSGLSLLLADGHAGVVGLSSSRIVERFGRPTFVFAPVANDATLITGSGRSIDEVHLRNALQWMADRRPHLFESPGTKMGGHRAAAGARVGASAGRRYRAGALPLVGRRTPTRGDLPRDGDATRATGADGTRVRAGALRRAVPGGRRAGGWGWYAPQTRVEVGEPAVFRDLVQGSGVQGRTATCRAARARSLRVRPAGERVSRGATPRSCDRGAGELRGGGNRSGRTGKRVG
jgi:single-stranded-DNA-specific exonuclease